MKLFGWYFLFTVYAISGRAQYVVNGNATQDNCHCYTLTPAINTQRGSVWNSNKISLTQPFDFAFDVYFGCQDVSGADGIAFILQPISTSIGSSGGGLGFSGIIPSIGVLMDTYQNTSEGDPTYDHINIARDGDVSHTTPNNLAGPLQIINGTDNIEDCQWHVLRVTWNPATLTLSAYIDGNLRVQHTLDLINNVFNGDPMVYWGFSASTGGLNNEQKFCTRLDAGFTTNVANDAVCLGQAIQFNPSVDAFVPITGYYWDFGDGTTYTQINPPPHTYTTIGPKIVRFAITGIDGCTSDTAIATVHVGSKPTVDFSFRDTCFQKPITFISAAGNAYGTVNDYAWLVNGAPVGNTPNITVNNLPTGNNQVIKLVVKTNFGCESDTATHTVNIFPRPDISAAAHNGCANELIQFTGGQDDALTTITSWHWLLPGNQTVTTQNTQMAFANPANYIASLYAISSQGCYSDTATALFRIVKPEVNAGNDTLVVQNEPFTLRGSGNGVQYTWSPSTGLSSPNILNPTAILADDQVYTLSTVTAEGCPASDEVRIQIFRGSEVYVPTGFTPNNDGRNDVLLPLYIGIKQLHYFVVYNRWGQELFRTTNMQQGWNGQLNGKDQPTGSYVWMLQATGVLGKPFQQKGTVFIIR